IAIVELARTLLPALSGDGIDSGRVWLIVVIAVVALFVSFAAAFGSGLVSHFADAELQLSLRRRIIRHLQRLPLGWFDARSSGRVRKLVEGDVNALHQLVAHAIHDVVTAIVVPLISLVYLFAVQWQLGLAALIPLVITVGLYALMMRGSSEKYVQYDEATARLSGATVEFVHGIAVVKRFGQAGRSHRRYRDEMMRYVEFVERWTREMWLFTVIEIITSPVVVMVWLLAVGLWVVDAGTAAPIDVLPAVLLGLGLTAPLMKLGSSGQFLRNAMKAQESLAAFLALPPVAQPENPREAEGHRLDFEGVSFAYDGEHRVLHDIAAHLSPSTVTALVGASGSGKSTLARIVTGLQRSQGTIRLDGKSLSRRARQRASAIVMQDVQRQLFTDTVSAEIALAAIDAPNPPDVSAVLQSLDLDHLAERHPLSLSGGQQQRLVVAGVRVAGRRIVVFDEPSSGVDRRHLASISDQIRQVAAGGAVVLLISHDEDLLAQAADQELTLTPPDGSGQHVAGGETARQEAAR
ncbi:MAG: ABC transporter ATP-binding protein/permease, partial [Corynebacterium sp.]|nr:ABC transporter ATP-binding protein/permease [Corynebacterium sp.]